MQDRLKELIVSITNRCNLKCKMCGIPFASNDGEMSTAELKKLIRDVSLFNPRSIVFSGGEPLLRKDLFELISFTRQYKINTCLTTNGILVSKEVALRLAEAGLGIINISIEGPQDVHDNLRGKGSFKKAIEAIENLTKNNIETTIATVVCKQTYGYLPELIKLAHQFGITTVKFQAFSEIFLQNRDKKKDFLIPKSNFGRVKEKIEETIQLSQRFHIATNPVSYLSMLSSYLCGIGMPRPVNDCYALWTSCPVSPEGYVYPCWTLSDKVIGNIKEVSILDLWDSKRHNFIRNLIKEKGCSGCLMSCYDENFGSDDIKTTFFIKTQKLKKRNFYRRFYNRAYQYLGYAFKRWYRRYKFYCSYKGLHKIFLRKLGAYIGRLAESGSHKEDKTEESLRQLRFLKQKFRTKLKSLKDEN